MAGLWGKEFLIFWNLVKYALIFVVLICAFMYVLKLLERGSGDGKRKK